MPNFKFFVGTNLEEFQKFAGKDKVIMVDGTIPGWECKYPHRHFDHHRKGGEKVQIDEMTEEWYDQPHQHDPQDIRLVLPYFHHDKNIVIATTQLDADACVAAAYFIAGGLFSPASMDRLRAIAYDCDHLGVPPELAHLKDFAFKAVATFIQPAIREAIPISLGIDPKDFKNWTAEQRQLVSSESFRRSTEWLVSAALGLRPWPGESGEADGYAAELSEMADRLISEGRISQVGEMAVGDGTGYPYVNPRSFYMAWERSGYGVPPLSLTYREHKASPTAKTYTIAALGGIDLTDGYFDALTAAERAVNPDADPWGGRATVGGSGWNTGSTLEPAQVFEALSPAPNPHNAQP